jgi:hypothetical protein
MNPDSHSRRDFAKSLALAAATPLLAQAEADPPAQKPKSPLVAAADAMSEVMRLQYREHLTDEQLQKIRQALERNLRSAESLRKYKLQNGDEPAFAFTADVV